MRKYTKYRKLYKHYVENDTPENYGQKCVEVRIQVQSSSSQKQI